MFYFLGYIKTLSGEIKSLSGKIKSLSGKIKNFPGFIKTLSGCKVDDIQISSLCQQCPSMAVQVTSSQYSLEVVQSLDLTDFCYDTRIFRS